MKNKLSIYNLVEHKNENYFAIYTFLHFKVKLVQNTQTKNNIIIQRSCRTIASYPVHYITVRLLLSCVRD